jgi:hypothetical protein
MKAIEPMPDAARRAVVEAILAADFRRATFAGPARRDPACPWMRVTIRPVEIQGGRHLQVSYFDGRKDVTKNFRGPDITVPLDQLLDAGFAGIHAATANEAIDLRTTKKGKVLIGRSKGKDDAPTLAHNRAKDLPLPEGRSDRVLEAMGILTRDGRVRPAFRAKFTQINEFLKQLGHVLEDAILKSLGRDVQILDCGCGSSYLTLAVHHYLNDVVGLPARILGVDVNEEVIRKSMERSERLGAERLSFACGTIGRMDTKADIVVALHACDTATDDAIAQAIRGEARILLSVPCCHHDLNTQLRAEGPAADLRPMLRHGILEQRTADLVTDAFRALILRILGYRTEVVEFIATEHTARNLMIRAVAGAPVGERAFVDEYLAMRRFWGVTPYLEKALGDTLGRWL